MTDAIRPCPICKTRTRMGARQKYCTRACQNRARYQPALPPANLHIVIPDTQIKPGVPLDQLEWIGQYINNHYLPDDLNITIIHLGDHWDMPSLSSYDQGKKSMEGRRIKDDIEAGNKAIGILDDHFGSYPNKHFLFGNHEQRIERAAEDDAQLGGFLDYSLLDLRNWTTHPYQSPVLLDGVTYSHVFYNPLSGRPYAGSSVELRLKTIGFSFTMGHQQGLWWARRELANGQAQLGLVAGACYLHEESYKGPQANDHWRGIVVCHNVDNGEYDPKFVSLDYLCREFVGCRLADYAPEMIA